MPTDEDKQIDAFAALVREYCEWAESSPGKPIEELRVAPRLLSQLYASALLLPDRFGDEDSRSISHEEWTERFKRLCSTPINDYWMPLYPIIEKVEDYNGCKMGIKVIADDLADIWRDLKVALELYDTGAVDAAVWDWHFNFVHHWGEHAASAILILHEWAGDNPRLFE